MAIVEKNLTGNVSCTAVAGVLNASAGLTGELITGEKVPQNDYESLINKPKINGVTLISDRSFEELGDHALTDGEIEEILKKAGF